MLRTLAITTAGVVLLVAAAGCGGSEEDTVRETVEAHIAAIEEDDGEAFCAVQSEATVEGAGGDGRCAETFGELLSVPQPEPEFGEIGEIQVDGNRATVEVALDGGTQTYDLVNEDGDWKMVGGATPTFAP